MSEWISVKDRLPEKVFKDGMNPELCESWPVLCFVDNQVQIYSFKWFDGKFMNICRETKKATHWMPLPEPPKDKS